MLVSNNLNIFLVNLCFIVQSSIACSQSVEIIESGQIEFERRENVYAILDKYYDTELFRGFIPQYKNANKQFKSTRFLLRFNQNKSLYAPIIDANQKSDFLDKFSYSNIILSDLVNKTGVTQKNIFEKSFIINDSIRTINWKLTGETREIMGFVCRRANAIIMDSIYIVAFYTDKIAPQSGPESFMGLPGMILGVALPYEHVTWFATNYSPKTDGEIKQESLRDGGHIKNKDLRDIIKSSSLSKLEKKQLDFLMIRAFL